jgi:hypothetical protein
VRAFLEKLEGRTPSRTEVLSIRAELEELERRVERIRRLAPAYCAVELGDDVKMLFRILRGKSGGFRAAASFL